MLAPALYAELAKAADTNASTRDLRGEPPKHLPRRRLCKSVVEADRLARCVELLPPPFRARLCVIIPTALRLICALRSRPGMGLIRIRCWQGMGPRSYSHGLLVMQPPLVSMFCLSLDLPTIPALWRVGVAR